MTLEQSGSNKSLGKDRVFWTNYERTLRTNGECPPPCNITSYELKYKLTDVIGDGVTIDIAFKKRSLIIVDFEATSLKVSISL